MARLMTANVDHVLGITHSIVGAWQLCNSTNPLFQYIMWLWSPYQNYGQADDSECGPCPGNNTQYCGGLAVM